MSIDTFMESVNPALPVWGTPVQVERRNRIRVTMAAFAYEYHSESIMSDGDFDKLCLQINPSISTITDLTDPEQIRRYEKIDRFFKEEFSPYTGQWIYKHPELDIVAQRYERNYKVRNI